MEYVYFTLAAVVMLIAAALGAFAYLVRRTDRSVSFRDVLSGKKWLAECILCLAAMVLALLVFLRGFPGGDKNFVRALIDGMTAIWLIVIGYIDLREKIIPNEMIGAGLLFWVLVLVVDIFLGGSPWGRALVFSLGGGLILGGILFVLALLLKSALGMGDVKMFVVLGLLYGLNDTYTMLLLSMVVMTVVSLVLLALKKVTPKTAVPMAPFVAAGFLLSILAGM